MRKRLVQRSSSAFNAPHTWNNVARIHGVLVLDEPKAVHEFDLGNIPGAMGRKVVLNIGLGSCDGACQLGLLRRRLVG